MADVDYPFQVVIIVPSAVGIGAVRLDDAVPSLPDSDGSHHYTSQLFKVCYCVTVHYIQYSEVKNNLLY